MMQSNARFTDTQVRLVIRKYPGRYIAELLRLCEKEFPMFKWDRNKVNNSLMRMIRYKPNAVIEIRDSEIELEEKRKKGIIKSTKWVKRVYPVVVLNEAQ